VAAEDLIEYGLVDRRNIGIGIVDNVM
jgi:hypothetical protein